MKYSTSHRICAAPMMDWTDRHCRYFLRLVSPRAMLYTEMVTTGALNETGTFVANEVLAKHDEKYMPPEVAGAMKKTGAVSTGG